MVLSPMASSFYLFPFLFLLLLSFSPSRGELYSTELFIDVGELSFSSSFSSSQRAYGCGRREHPQGGISLYRLDTGFVFLVFELLLCCCCCFWLLLVV